MVARVVRAARKAYIQVDQIDFFSNKTLLNGTGIKKGEYASGTVI